MNKLNWWPYTDEEWEYLNNPPKQQPKQLEEK
jgi:hypothetical protein